MHSVVIIKLATEAESRRAVFTTLVGSTIPSFFMSTYFPVAALKPIASFFSSRSLAKVKLEITYNELTLETCILCDSPGRNENCLLNDFDAS